MEDGLRARHPAAAILIAVCGLVPVLAASVVIADEGVVEPLVPTLLIGAAAFNVMDVRFEGRLWVSGSFLCCLMAAAVVGPSAGAAVAFGSELAAWAVMRYRVAPFLVNSFATVTPTFVAGLLVLAAERYVGSTGLDFDAALGVIACLELTLNLVIVSTLIGLHEGYPLLHHVSVYRRLAPFLVANVVLLISIVEAYRQVGLAAALFLVVVMLLFTFVVRLLIDARDRTVKIKELATSRGRLVAEAVNAEDRARRSLAQQLHDDALQSLLVARQDLEEAMEGDQHGLMRADAAVRSTVHKLRDAVFELHPAILDHAGLREALNAVAHEEGHRAEFSPHVAVAAKAEGMNDQFLFSLARELIANAARHAGASNVWISVTLNPTTLELAVRDDGKGLDEQRRADAVRTGHIGLASSLERVEALSGSMRIRSAPGAGTDVRIQLPISELTSLDVSGASPTTPVARDA